ncbi:MAG: sigma-70 family RNA polymerase sigma factor [Bacteroidota bacterium]
MKEEDIIKGCIANERNAQETLYRTYSSRMFGVCLRYAPNRDVAHDMLQEGFIKVFQNLINFKGQSALSSWMHRIFMTTAINYLQRKLKTQFEVSLNESITERDADDISEEEKDHWLNHISTHEALDMVQQLPEKYRLIINLYAIEKLKHDEISVLLNISESSSRSQLSRARKLLSEMLQLKLKRKLGL